MYTCEFFWLSVCLFVACRAAHATRAWPRLDWPDETATVKKPVLDTWEPFPCTQKIATTNNVVFKFPEYRFSEVIGVSKRRISLTEEIPFFLTGASWNSEDAEFTVDCGHDRSSFLCTKFLTQKDCISREQFCVKIREKTGQKTWLTVTIKSVQTLMPFEDYKPTFHTKTCPRNGFHKQAILEGRPSYKICGPFNLYKFHAEESKECQVPGGSNDENMWYLHRNKIRESDPPTNQGIPGTAQPTMDPIPYQKRRRRRRRALTVVGWHES